MGPHDLFPPDAMRRFRPGDHVCIAPESKEHSSWRSGTVIDMTVVATDEPRYAISLKADSMDPLGGTATAKGEIQCSSRVLKYYKLYCLQSSVLLFFTDLILDRKSNLVGMLSSGTQMKPSSISLPSGFSTHYLSRQETMMMVMG